MVLGFFPTLALSDPPPMIYYDIDIISPEEDSQYTDPTNTGHYPATFSFEDDQDTANPSGWEILNEAGGDISVQNNLGGHEKVVELKDISFTDGISMKNSFNRESGTIEWWFRKNYGDTNCIFNFFGDPEEKRAIKFFGGSGDYFKAWDGSVMYQDNRYSEDTWFHLRIDFECGTGNYKGLLADTYDLYIDGELVFDDFHFQNPIDEMTYFLLGTNSWLFGMFYVDAIGYSWDNYFVNDNKYEGIELEWYCPYNLLATRYNLDSRGWQNVEGITYIPMLEEWEHVIKMDGYDAQDRWHRSYDRTFFCAIDVTELDAPTWVSGSTASWHDAECHIIWDEVDYAESYEVYYKSSSQQEFSLLAETTDNFYDWSCFTEDYYYVKVRTCRKSDDPDLFSPFSNEIICYVSYQDPWNVELTETFYIIWHYYEASWDGPSQIDLDHVDYQVQRRYFGLWYQVTYTQEEFTAWNCDGFYHFDDCDQVRVRLIWRENRRILPIGPNLLKASDWAYSNTV